MYNVLNELLYLVRLSRQPVETTSSTLPVVVAIVVSNDKQDFKSEIKEKCLLCHTRVHFIELSFDMRVPACTCVYTIR